AISCEPMPSSKVSDTAAAQPFGQLNIRHLFLRSTESTEGTEGSVFLRALRVPPCLPRPLLAHGPERLEAAVDALQRRVGVALLLDDVPLGPADGLAQLEDRLPGHVALADQGLVVGGG